MAVRQLEHSDFDAFYDMQGNDNVMRYVKDTLSYEEAKEELDRFIGYYDDNDRFFNAWAVIGKKSSHFLGMCGVYENEHGETEIFYRFRERYWGQGYGKEIAMRLIDYCTETLGLTDLTAYVDPRNIGSVKILEMRMRPVREFYSEKFKCIERVYKLSQ